MIIVVRSIFSAIKRLEEMEFARTLDFDKENGRVEWRNKWTGDRAEIIFDKIEKCCTIDIYCFKNGENEYSFKLKRKETHMNGKITSIPTTKPSELEKAWQEAATLWEQSEFNPLLPPDPEPTDLEGENSTEGETGEAEWDDIQDTPIDADR